MIHRILIQNPPRNFPRKGPRGPRLLKLPLLPRKSRFLPPPRARPPRPRNISPITPRPRKARKSILGGPANGGGAPKARGPPHSSPPVHTGFILSSCAIIASVFGAGGGGNSLLSAPFSRGCGRGNSGRWGGRWGGSGGGCSIRAAGFERTMLVSIVSPFLKICTLWI